MTNIQTTFSVRMTKDDFEALVKQKITDSQWLKVVSEIDGRLENFVEGLISELIDDCEKCNAIFEDLYA